MERLKKEQNPAQIQYLISALGKTRHPRAVDALLPWLDHQDRGISLAAARALGKIGMPANRPELQEMFWDRDRARLLGADLRLLNPKYYQQVTTTYKRVCWVALALLLLLPMGLAMVTARVAVSWFIRLGITLLNAVAGFHVGAVAGFLGASLTLYSEGGAHPLIAIFYGAYCAVFCGLGGLIKIGGDRTWIGAMAMAALSLLFVPLLMLGFAAPPWETAAWPLDELPGTVASVLPVSVVIFLDYLLISRINRGLLEGGADTMLDRMSWKWQAAFALLLAGVCMLPLPLTRLLVGLLM